MNFKKLFTEYLAEPNDSESKWLIVGFFSAIMILGTAIFPIMLLIVQLRDVVQFSFNQFAILIGVVSWGLGYTLTLKYWLYFSINFGYLMYLSGERDKKRKAAKLALKGVH